MTNIIRINKKTTASFDIDAENCFTPLCPDELAIKDGHLIVKFLNQNAKLARIRIGSKDWHLADADWVSSEEKPQFSIVEGDFLDLDIHWDLHGVGGTYGAQLIEGLPKEEDYDFFVWKGMERNLHPYGACYHDLRERLSTGVIQYLKCEKISTVILGGLALDHCVKNTALQLARAGFKVIINLESCKGIAEKSIEKAIMEMKELGVIFVNSASEIKAI
jgi:nicotinamidase/pyrazinamidase